MSTKSTSSPTPVPEATPSLEEPLAVTYEDVEAAATRLEGVVHRTPVMTSRTFDATVNGQVFFKCENFQRTGAFKLRGAYNALSQLAPNEKERGVIAYSSGNHAQAVALAGNLLDIPATILMPENAPTVKMEATRGYGAEVITYDPETTVREEKGEEIASERGLKLIPPYDHPDVVAGQGTAGDELFDEVGDLDALLVCCGGGGLLSGCAIAASERSPDCDVIGVEPAQADDAVHSFHTGTLHRVHSPQTIADGARTPFLGEITFPIVLERAADMVAVSEQAIRDTMLFLWERMKIVVEPTGVLAAAALLDGVVPGRERRIGVIVSGGNVDLQRAAELFEDA